MPGIPRVFRQLALLVKRADVVTSVSDIRTDPLLPAHGAGDGAFVGVAEGGEGEVEEAGGVEAVGGFDLADEDSFDAVGFGDVEQGVLSGAGADADDDAGAGFAEEDGRPGLVFAGREGEVGDGDADFGAFVGCEAGLGEGDGEAAFGAVMGGLEQALGDGGADGSLDAEFDVEVEARGRAFVAAVDQRQVFAAADAGL